MKMFIWLALAFLTGITTKLVDEIEDEGLQLFNHANILFGVLYGILIGYMAVNYPIIAPLWMGVVIGLMLYGKIDGPGHYVGVGVTFIYLLFFGIPELNGIMMLIFIAACLFDEFISDRADQGRIKNRSMNKIAEVRPFVEITAFIAAAVTSTWIIFFAILLFDAGYIGMTKLAKKFC